MCSSRSKPEFEPWSPEKPGALFNTEDAYVLVIVVPLGIIFGVVLWLTT
jgi:hypothetical protein